MRRPWENRGGMERDALKAIVQQAAGMVSVQADCTVVQAVRLLDKRAMAEGQTLEQVAKEVLEHRYRFESSEVD